MSLQNPIVVIDELEEDDDIIWLSTHIAHEIDSTESIRASNHLSTFRQRYWKNALKMLCPYLMMMSSACCCCHRKPLMLGIIE